MSMDDSTRRPGFEALGDAARVEFRMLTDGQPITDEQRRELIAELGDWRKDHPQPQQPDKPHSIKRLAELIGVGHATLSEVLAGKYRGDADKVLRLIDQFLADEREKAGRFDFRQHAAISLTRKIFGAIQTGIRNSTMPVIIGPPGCGKTAHARAFVHERAGALYLRMEDAPTDKRGVTKIFCQTINELRPMLDKPHTARLASIKSWLRKRRNTVLIVDEAQKLSASGLELLRDLHDGSDPSGAHCMPIVFFGDEHFYKLLLRSRSGQSSPIAPQMIRRMIPLFDIARDGSADGDGGLYSVEDVLKIVRNDRIKLLTPRAARWLTDLANVAGFGHLGFAVRVLQLACDLMQRSGGPGGGASGRIDVPLLQAALAMTGGQSVAIEIDAAAGGELLRKVS